MDIREWLKNNLIYILTTGFLIAIISYVSLVLLGSFRDNRDEWREVKGVEVQVDNSIDVSKQSRALEDSAHQADDRPTTEHRWGVARQELDIIVTIILRAVGEADAKTLHELLSDELKSLFDINSLGQSMGAAEKVSLQRRGQMSFGPDGYASQVVVGQGQSGKKYEYVMVFRQQGGEWKLFGTVSN